MMDKRSSSADLPAAVHGMAHFGPRLVFLLALPVGSLLGGESDPASLSRMRAIVEPEPIGWWPLAPGGFLVLYLLLGAVLYGLYRWSGYWAANRYRRLALKELAELRGSVPDVTTVTALSALLKRTALTGYPRSEVASLTGASWRSFLEKTSGSFRDAGEAHCFFALGVYDPERAGSLGADDWDCACRAVGIWIRTHRLLRPKGEAEGEAS